MPGPEGLLSDSARVGGSADRWTEGRWTEVQEEKGKRDRRWLPLGAIKCTHYREPVS